VKRLLLVSPHFPPDATAGAHRARVLAPYLDQYGWRPSVLTVDPRDYEGLLDDELAAHLPASIEIVRCRAWPARWTRRAGIGDLGLRALAPLWRESRARAAAGHVDAVFITTYPIYPALIGPRLKRRFGVPFMIDLQDPWVGAWGSTVGGGPGGRVDIRSRLSRRAASTIERRVVPHADAMTSVSSGLLEDLAARYPTVASRPRAVLPIGIDPADMRRARNGHRAPAWAPPADGRLHVCYVGTALPLGVDTLRAVFDALARVRARRPQLADRLRLHFIGTSNEARADAARRVEPLAAGAGVADLMAEHPPRVPFYDALRALDRAGVVLLAGTSEARYTASKLHAALAAGRPILALFHAGSDVARTLAPIAASDRGVWLMTYDEQVKVETLVGPLADLLERWAADPPQPPARASLLDEAEAPALARRLAALLDTVVGARG
jgi:glycosyltransferase involved in cell wall biosynthesis